MSDRIPWEIQSVAYKYDRQMRDLAPLDSVFFELPKLPDHVRVRVIYPFGLLAARVIFYHNEFPDQKISVYLDVTDAAGSVGQPYFELYPNEKGDCSRYLLHEQEDMYKEIFALLDKKSQAHLTK